MPLDYQELPIDVADPTNSKDLGGNYACHVTDDGVYTIAKDGKVVRQYLWLTKEERKNWGKDASDDAEIIQPCIEVDHPNALERQRGHPDREPYVCYASYVRRTLQDMRSEFEKNREEYEGSGVEAFLKERMAMISRERHLVNIVSFGTSSLQAFWEDERRAAHFQIMAMMTMLASINDGRDKQDMACCLSQEPRYTDLDKEFLKTCGIEAVDDPAGFDRIGPESVFCDWSGDDFVPRQVSEGPWPAVIIDPGMELIRNDKDWSQKTLLNYFKLHDGETCVEVNRDQTLTSAEAQRILEMVDSCEHKAFPDFPDHDSEDSSFSHYIMYWRKKDDRSS
ncbi:MAG: hypothetical protein Q9170_002031 [Blastenia crenularia]